MKNDEIKTEKHDIKELKCNDTPKIKKQYNPPTIETDEQFDGINLGCITGVNQ